MNTAQSQYQSLPALQRSTQDVEARLTVVVEHWETLCTHSRIYADRLRLVQKTSLKGFTKSCSYKDRIRFVQKESMLVFK